MPENGEGQAEKQERKRRGPLEVSGIAGHDAQGEEKDGQARGAASIRDPGDQEPGQADPGHFEAEQAQALEAGIGQVEDDLVEPVQVQPFAAGAGEGKHVLVGDGPVLEDPAAGGQVPPDVEFVDLAPEQGEEEDTQSQEIEQGKNLEAPGKRARPRRVI